MFQHVEIDSFFHRLNPTMKFLAIFLAGLALLLITEPIPMLFLLGLALFCLLVLARIPLKSAVRGILPFLALALGLVWVHTLFSQAGGEILWRWGPVAVGAQSLSTGVALGLRVVAIVTLGYLFAATTDPRYLVVSMVQQAKLPYKLAFGLYIAFRFLPIMTAELETLQAAHRIRGGHEEKGWSGQLRAFKRLMVPLFVSVIRKSIQLGLAMESKAFGAYPDRTYLFETKVRRRDWLFLAGVLLLLALSLYGFARAGYLTRIGL